MFRMFFGVCAVAVFVSSAAFAASKAEILKDNMEMAQRLEDVAAGVLVNNPDICGDYKAPYLGAEFMTTDSVSGDYQSLVAEQLGVVEYPTVTILGKGSPAAGALRVRDVVKTLNGKALGAGKEGVYALQDAVASGRPLSLGVERAGNAMSVDIKPASVCGAKIRLDSSDENSVEARDGKVFVSKGALRGVSDKQALAESIKSELSRYKQ